MPRMPPIAQPPLHGQQLEVTSDPPMYGPNQVDLGALGKFILKAMATSNSLE
jgi:hypothetical protein